MSASVVAGPVLTRIAPRASSAGTPMAASTCEGATFPEEQAAPDETAIPSRSNAITSGFGLGAGHREQRGVRQPLGLLTENDRVAASRARSPASSRSRRRAM